MQKNKTPHLYRKRDYEKIALNAFAAAIHGPGIPARRFVVAEFGLLLRNSEFKSAASYGHVIKSARNARGKDEQGYSAEFVRLVESASMLAKSNLLSKLQAKNLQQQVLLTKINRHLTSS